jgi:hypothetical protein
MGPLNVDLLYDIFESLRGHFTFQNNANMNMLLLKAAIDIPNIDIFTLLLEHCADIHAKNEKGETCADLIENDIKFYRSEITKKTRSIANYESDEEGYSMEELEDDLNSLEESLEDLLSMERILNATLEFDKSQKMNTNVELSYNSRKMCRK